MTATCTICGTQRRHNSSAKIPPAGIAGQYPSDCPTCGTKTKHFLGSEGVVSNDYPVLKPNFGKADKGQPAPRHATAVDQMFSDVAAERAASAF